MSDSGSDRCSFIRAHAYIPHLPLPQLLRHMTAFLTRLEWSVCLCSKLWLHCCKLRGKSGFLVLQEVIPLQIKWRENSKSALRHLGLFGRKLRTSKVLKRKLLSYSVGAGIKNIKELNWFVCFFKSKKLESCHLSHTRVWDICSPRLRERWAAVTETIWWRKPPSTVCLSEGRRYTTSPLSSNTCACLAGGGLLQTHWCVHRLCGWQITR